MESKAKEMDKPHKCVSSEKGGLRMGFWGYPPFRMGRGQGPTKEMEKQQSERR